MLPLSVAHLVCLSSISLCLVRRRQRGCAQPTNLISREQLLDDILGLHALHPLPNGSILLPWASSHSNGLHPRRRDARDPSNHVFHLVGGSLLTFPRLSRFCCMSALALVMLSWSSYPTDWRPTTRLGDRVHRPEGGDSGWHHHSDGLSRPRAALCFHPTPFFFAFQTDVPRTMPSHKDRHHSTQHNISAMPKQTRTRKNRKRQRHQDVASTGHSNNNCTLAATRHRYALVAPTSLSSSPSSTTAEGELA